MFKDGNKLLILEPDLNMLAFLEKNFANQGFEVFVATHGEQAYDLIIKERIVAMVCSAEISGNPSTAISLIDKLNISNTTPSVICIITEDSNYKISDAFDRGIDAVFVKPFEVKTLVALVKSSITPHLDNEVYRRVSRVSASFSVEVKNNISNELITGFAENLAQGGLFISVQHGFPPKIGDYVEVKIMLSDANFIKGNGTVTWLRSLQIGTNKVGFGIKFDVDKSETEKIYQLVNTLKIANFDDE